MKQDRIDCCMKTCSGWSCLPPPYYASGYHNCSKKKPAQFAQCSKHKASYTRAHRMVREPNARMCGQDCKPVLCHPRTVGISFATNQNLSVFRANTKKTRCAGCPLHAPGVLCSPHVHGKLINCVPLKHRMRTAQGVNGALVYAKL